jgi:uncharacterized iron-regulated protein
MKRYITLCLIIISTTLSYSQNISAYQVFDSNGKKVKSKKMMKKLKTADFVFFGEYHDNPISHWMQYEVTKVLFEEHGTDLMLAFEMFERDQQDLINDYISGKMEDKAFEDSCRLWPNYKTDYKPLVRFAADSGLHVVASNVPRRYANLLYKKGRKALDTLSSEEKLWMAPSDFIVDTTLSQYAQLLEMGQHMGGGNLMLAQAFKDATMSKFTLADRNDNNVVIHYNGAYHSDYHQGIVWYIAQELPDAEIITISTVAQKGVSKLEKDNKGRADFIICVDEEMTSTH